MVFSTLGPFSFDVALNRFDQLLCTGPSIFWASSVRAALARRLCNHKKTLKIAEKNRIKHFQVFFRDKNKKVYTYTGKVKKFGFLKFDSLRVFMVYSLPGLFYFDVARNRVNEIS